MTRSVASICAVRRSARPQVLRPAARCSLNPVRYTALTTVNIVPAWFLLLCFIAPAAAAAQTHDTVWVWSNECVHPKTLALEVRFDGREVYRTQLPICRAERSAENADGVSFRFASNRPIVWVGYRSETGDTSTVGPLQGIIWQAGGESDHLILGVAFTADSTLYMNSLFRALPDRPARDDYARGLEVRTFPVSPGRR